MKKISITIGAILILGGMLLASAPKKAITADAVAAEANDRISQGISMLMDIAFQQGFARGYAQAEYDLYKKNKRKGKIQ